MSNNEKTNGYHALKVRKFDHSCTTPRATRWREWVVKLRYAFGSAYPLLTNQTSEVLDPSKYWWGLTWSPLLDFDNFNQEQDRSSMLTFRKFNIPCWMFCLRISACMTNRLSQTTIMFSLWKNSRSSTRSFDRVHVGP